MLEQNDLARNVDGVVVGIARSFHQFPENRVLHHVGAHEVSPARLSDVHGVVVIGGGLVGGGDGAEAAAAARSAISVAE